MNQSKMEVDKSDFVSYGSDRYDREILLGAVDIYKTEKKVPFSEKTIENDIPHDNSDYDTVMSEPNLQLKGFMMQEFKIFDIDNQEYNCYIVLDDDPYCCTSRKIYWGSLHCYYSGYCANVERYPLYSNT